MRPNSTKFNSILVAASIITATLISGSFASSQLPDALNNLGTYVSDFPARLSTPYQSANSVGTLASVIGGMSTGIGIKDFSTESNDGAFWNAVLPPCGNSVTTSCIEEVAFRSATEVNAAWKNGTLDANSQIAKPNLANEQGTNLTGFGPIVAYPNLKTWNYDAATNRPAGGASSIWNLNGASHGSSNSYLVRVSLSNRMITGTIGYVPPNFVRRYLEAQIIPISNGKADEFASNIEFKLRVKLGVNGKNLWGWFATRLMNPAISLDSESDSGIVEISGAPITIPVGATPSKKYSDMSDGFKSQYVCNSAQMFMSGCKSPPSTLWMNQRSLERIASDSAVSQERAFRGVIAASESELGSYKTIGTQSLWFAQSSTSAGMTTACFDTGTGTSFTNKYVGLQTSNASVTLPGAPSWDDASKSLNFILASPHLDQAGKPNVGYYQLSLPIEQAKCRWGNNLTGAQVNISVTSADGANKVTTSTIKMDDKNVYFVAAGFSYSAPKVSITIVTSKAGAAKAPTGNITLKVAPDQTAGYVRAKFKLWIDADKDGCDTRREVLIAEAIVKPLVGANCTIKGGKWISPYDGVTHNAGATLDIDHLVPLAEAWRSGAWKWTNIQRQNYANDLTDPRALVAVTAGLNRAKGDQDPSTWLPPLDQCGYISNWIAIKAKYSLTVDSKEAQTLRSEITKCEITNVAIR